ncbi:MAG: RHS repeat-associated core domain-containing protein [Gammaproteobacteria bacterium]
MKKVSWTIWAVVVVVVTLAFEKAGATPVPENGLSDLITALQLTEPVVATTKSTDQDRAEIERLIERTASMSRAEKAEAIAEFIDHHPHSPFRVALEANLGFQYLHDGYVSRAITSLSAAWEHGREARGLAIEALVDKAVGDLLVTHARLGHSNETERLLTEISGRPIMGSADVAVSTARDGLWQIQHEPEQALRCGAMALNALLQSRHSDAALRSELMNIAVDKQGMSLAQIAKLAEHHGVTLKAVRSLQRDAVVPVPAIVHWNVGHYAAVLAKNGKEYLVDDPVFGGRKWISSDALQAETSGHFLVLADAPATDWAELATKEAANIRGAGYTNTDDPLYTRPQDHKECDQPCGSSNPPGGMPVPAVHSMLVSLNIVDRPVSYTPPKGTDVDVVLTYNQKESDLQPAVFTYSNFGPKWNFNWLSFIQDDPNSPGNSVMRYVAGGGGQRYSGFNSSTGAFTPEKRSGAQLVKTAANTYELRDADGSKEVFGFSDGSTGYPRKIFMTQRVDAAGNAVTLQYDAQRRLTGIVDAIGQTTTLQYTHTNPLLITAITDPFGRKATVTYDTSGRLSSIKDAINLTSSFTYDTGTFITAMTTPYGTTQFAYGEGDNRQRWLEITDALGKKSRVEFRHNAPYPAFDQTPPTNDFRTTWFHSRNTYYWDQTAMALAPGDYTKARIKHWVHRGDKDSETDGVLESVKYPLENQIWYKYPGQGDTAFSGSFDKPILIAQTQPDGTAKLERYEYNQFGKVTRYINPLGHEYVYEYDTNQIDLLRIKRRRVSTDTLDTFAQYTYNTQHRVLTYTDAAGGITRYTYNTAGQLLSQITPANETTSYAYDAKGYLTSITNPRAQTAVTYTYDAVGRVNKRTDSQGSIQYAYDNLDRLTTTTYSDTTTETNTYDKLDVSVAKDRNGKLTRYAYDAVRNLVSVTDPLNQVVQYTYFENRLPKTVKDARNNVTSWTRDIQGRVLSESSPDRGATTYTYDVVGNLATTTDARGNTTTYTRDKLRRLTKELYSNGETSDFAYDGTVNGELGTLTNATKVGPFKYDSRGWLVEQGGGSTQTETVSVVGVILIAGRPFLTRVPQVVVATPPRTLYSYTSAGRLASITYPSGKVVTYNYSGGMVSDVSVNGTTILSNVTHTPMEPITGWTWGNGTVHPRTLDADYHVRSYKIGSATRDLTYDSEGNLLIVVDSATSSLGPTYTNADDLGRVISETNLAKNLAWTYDSNGNRISTRIGLGNTPYSLTYSGSSNRLLSLSGPTARTFTYDAAGNITSNGSLIYQYSARGRLAAVNPQALTSWSNYRYNALGQLRARDMDADTNRRFAYDPAGHLLGEYSSLSGGFSQETVWLGDIPVAVLSGTNTIQYIHADHLNTPRALTDTTGKVLWRWDSNAFGEGLPNEDVDGDGVKVTYNLRFPGQYYDKVTGKHYNYFRDYDPETGRYLESDPIGLAGGLNTYAYVGANPLTRFDPFGLAWNCTYVQSTGRLYCVDDETGKSVYERCYSGSESRGGKNDPDKESERRTGPIPRGGWDIGGYDNSKGPRTIDLSPRSGTETYGRDLFRIHGDSRRHPGNASEGCIICDLLTREKLTNGSGGTVTVIRAEPFAN